MRNHRRLNALRTHSRCMFIAMTAAAAATTSAIADAPHHRRNPAALPAESKPARALATDRLPLAATPFERVFHADRPNIDVLLAEDAVSTGPQRIGVPLEVSVTAADGDWQHLPGRGWLWTVSIVAEDAVAIRLHFADTDMPHGGELAVRDATGVQQVFGPIRGRGENKNGAFITPPTLGDEVLVEYFEPGDGTAAPRLPFRIENVTHIYSPAFLNTGPSQIEGACHNDVTCYPAWATPALAVARLIVTDGGTFNCTAALINTNTNDETPYLLTANHCSNDPTAAANLVAYWLYQTDVCDDPPPPLGPSSTNAVIIDFTPTGVNPFQPGADQVLLLMRGALPAGVTWAGWTSSAVGNSVACSNVHHPGGAYKRINFGTTQNHPFGDNADYIGITWSSGTIEGGSSGSPLFRDTDQLLFAVGSHSADPANCTNPDGPSGFGRFSQFFPQISDDLIAGPDDPLEPNDACNAAVMVGAGVHADRYVKSTSEDWYAIDLGGCERVDIDATFVHSWGDIDLELYDGCGGGLIDSATTSTDDESLTFDNTGFPMTAFLRVFIAGTDTHAEYDLSVSFTSIGNPPNITDHPDGQTVGVGDPVMFTVGADGDAPLSYQWKKDGAEIPSATGVSYAISSADPNDAGDYTVVVTNDCDSVESEVATLIVEFVCGDFDGDGDVDVTDFGAFALCYGGPFVPPALSCQPGVDADCDGDGDVDLGDFGIFSQNFTGAQ